MAQEVNEMNIEKLREEVNPVYSTAHSCLRLVAATGDEDSENLRKVLGFTRFGEMRKALAGDSDFSLINVSDQVKEIIETTGFDTIFC